MVWSGGGELRKFRGEPAAVSHCVHGECHITPPAQNLRLHSHKLQSDSVSCDMTWSGIVFIHCAVLQLSTEPLRAEL